MTPATNKNIEHLTVDFYEVRVGWLFFKLTVGQQTFDGWFSEAFDPLLNFKHWLEAISMGVQQTSFRYNAEGYYVKFDFEKVSWDREVMIISIPEKGEIIIKADIDRQQIVKAFYVGLLTFASSDRFTSKDWEIEYLKERLYKIFEKDEENLIEELADLDRKELQELLFFADPTYEVSFPTAKDKSEEIGLFYDMIIENKELPEGHLMKRTPDEWNIPDDYNFWPKNRKKEFITGCVNEPTAGFHGTKIDEFRSLIIEKYLDNG